MDAACAIIKNEPCRFPEKVLSSLDGYGVDVYNTVNDTPLKYINGQNTVTLAGCVSEPNPMEQTAGVRLSCQAVSQGDAEAVFSG